MDGYLAALTAGTTFAGEFRVIRPLGVGGMGAVYVVEQVTTGRQRALKTLHPYLVRDRKHRERFEQEARVGAGIRSDHVVQVIGAGVDADSGIPWLAMELLDGKDLASLIEEEGPKPAFEVARIYQQLCHAVGAAHAMGVVHRDLKPENVFLAESRSSALPFMVKVLDFGIAKIVAEGRSRTTAAMGTPLWMAPEQTESGGRITPATDVWALGLMAFWMLTGQSYWNGSREEDIAPMMLLREVVLDPLVTASVRAGELGRAHLLPQGFDAWFGRCLDRDPTKRYPDAAHAHDALVPILAAAVPSDPQASLVVTPLVDSLGRTAPVTPRFASHDGMTSRAGASTTGPTTTEDTHPEPPTLVSPDLDVQSDRPPSSTRRRWVWPVAIVTALSATLLAGSQLVSYSTRVAVQEAVVSVQNMQHDKEMRQEREAMRDKNLAMRVELDRHYGRMLRIEPGTFRMGAEDGNLNEQPAHAVTLPAYEIDEREVSVGHYSLCVRQGRCEVPGADVGCNYSLPTRRDHPVNCVTLSQAKTFCAFVAKRLPTEEEWEYATRGTDGRAYAWGEGVPAEQLCWNRPEHGEGETGTCLVGSHPEDRGAGGVLDASGNVREWTISAYCPYARKGCTAETWVIRGGAWSDTDPLGVRAPLRNGKPADYRSDRVGFRCARDPL